MSQVLPLPFLEAKESRKDVAGVPAEQTVTYPDDSQRSGALAIPLSCIAALKVETGQNTQNIQRYTQNTLERIMSMNINQKSCTYNYEQK